MINVVCVKTGTKYKSEIVNRLYRMVKKNLTLPFNFYCLTENPNDLYPEIKIHDISDYIESGIDGFWPKICVFDSKIYEHQGPTLYLDLDVIIQKNIDQYLEKITPGKIKVCYIGATLCLLENDFNMGYDHPTEINSSIMIFNSYEFYSIFETFITNPYFIIKEYKGVCRYLWATKKDKLEYLETLEDYYPTSAISTSMKLKEDQWLDYRWTKKDGRWVKNRKSGLLHIPHVPFCIWNRTMDRKKVFDLAEELFSDYYK